jgi:hypothetical protein
MKSAFAVMGDPGFLLAEIGLGRVIAGPDLADAAVGGAAQQAVIGAQDQGVGRRRDRLHVGGDRTGVVHLDGARGAFRLRQRLPFLHDALQVAAIVLGPARGVEAAEADAGGGQALEVAAGAGEADAGLAEEVALGVLAIHGDMSGNGHGDELLADDLGHLLGPHRSPTDRATAASAAPDGRGSAAGPQENRLPLCGRAHACLVETGQPIKLAPARLAGLRPDQVTQRLELRRGNAVVGVQRRRGGA